MSENITTLWHYDSQFSQSPTSFQLFQPTNSFKFTPCSLSLPSDVRTPDLTQILASYNGTTQFLWSVSINASHSPSYDIGTNLKTSISEKTTRPYNSLSWMLFCSMWPAEHPKTYSIMQCLGDTMQCVLHF